MSKKGYLTLLITLSVVSLAYAEKFDSSFSTDYTSQNNKFKITSTPAISKTTTDTYSLSSSQGISTKSTTSIESPSFPAQMLPVNQAYKPTPVISTTKIKTATSISDLKKPKITVPNYEKQLQSILKQQQIKLKKKMTFMESITNEINRYGMLIVLILVLLVILYAVHKDKAPEAPHLAEKPEAEAPKKNIWDEDF